MSEVNQKFVNYVAFLWEDVHHTSLNPGQIVKDTVLLRLLITACRFFVFVPTITKFCNTIH